MISSKEQLEQTALHFGVLPFFANKIAGFSVCEMAAPGMLFGGANDEDDGCWEWKGPVIREQTTAYGKFFNRKAGFVSLDLLSDFLNYRRHAYPVRPDSTDSMILDIIRENEGLSSTELRRRVFGTPASRRRQDSLVDTIGHTKSKRHSLEGPLQRLQAGGWLLICDFQYKLTKLGERYGWGVALYSTPEIWFERDFDLGDVSPYTSFRRLVNTLSKRLPGVDTALIASLLK